MRLHKIEYEKRDIIKRKIKHIEKNLREKIIIQNAAKNDVPRKTEVCLKDLQKRKEESKDEIEKQFGQMKREFEDQMTQTCRSPD